MEVLVEKLIETIWVIVGVLLIIKSILFYKNKSGRWKFAHFIYFKKQNFQSTKSERRVKKKKFQNFLSIILFIFIVALITLGIVQYKYFPTPDQRIEPEKEVEVNFTPRK